MNNSTGIQPVPEQDNYLHKGAIAQHPGIRELTQQAC